MKTAYEMSISDWSSDVCSSDLPSVCGHAFQIDERGAAESTRRCGGGQLVARASTQALSGRLPGLPARRVDVPRRQGEAGVPTRWSTAMGDHVYKSTELPGYSTKSLDAALPTAIVRASTTVS